MITTVGEGFNMYPVPSFAPQLATNSGKTLQNIVNKDEITDTDRPIFQCLFELGMGIRRCLYDNEWMTLVKIGPFHTMGRQS